MQDRQYLESHEYYLGPPNTCGTLTINFQSIVIDLALLFLNQLPTGSKNHAPDKIILHLRFHNLNTTNPSPGVCLKPRSTQCYERQHIQIQTDHEFHVKARHPSML